MKKNEVNVSTIMPSNVSEKKPSNPLRVLVVTGGPAFYHQTKLVPTSFYTLFEGYDDIVWDHATSDEAAFASDFRENYDVLVIFNRSDSISTAAQRNLRDFVESGKGVVVMHSALGSYNEWERWWHDVVGGKYQMKDTDKMRKSDYKLDEHITVSVAADHPITSAVGDFKLFDETYKDLWISPQVKIIYKTNNPTSDGPIVWISPYSKSRIVVIQLGHGPAAHRNPAYRALVYNSIVWAGGR